MKEEGSVDVGCHLKFLHKPPESKGFLVYVQTFNIFPPGFSSALEKRRGWVEDYALLSTQSSTLVTKTATKIFFFGKKQKNDRKKTDFIYPAACNF